MKRKQELEVYTVAAAAATPVWVPLLLLLLLQYVLYLLYVRVSVGSTLCTAAWVPIERTNERPAMFSKLEKYYRFIYLFICSSSTHTYTECSRDCAGVPAVRIHGMLLTLEQNARKAHRELKDLSSLSSLRLVRDWSMYYYNY